MTNKSLYVWQICCNYSICLSKKQISFLFKVAGFIQVCQSLNCIHCGP